MSNGHDDNEAKGNGSQMAVKTGGPGQVTREKYEQILQRRIQTAISAQEAIIWKRRPDALQAYLKRNGLAGKMASYRVLLEELIEFFGEPEWRQPAWLRDDHALFEHTKVREGVEAILHETKELRPIYDEIERLRRIESQITEKVWLAGAPSEIAALLKEIGEPAA